MPNLCAVWALRPSPWHCGVQKRLRARKSRACTRVRACSWSRTSMALAPFTVADIDGASAFHGSGHRRGQHPSTKEGATLSENEEAPSFPRSGITKRLPSGGSGSLLRLTTRHPSGEGKAAFFEESGRGILPRERKRHPSEREPRSHLAS